MGRPQRQKMLYCESRTDIRLKCMLLSLNNLTKCAQSFSRLCMTVQEMTYTQVFKASHDYLQILKSCIRVDKQRLRDFMLRERVTLGDEICLS